MQLNAYTAFTKLFLFVLSNFIILSNGYGQNENDIYDLRIHTEVNCADNVLTASLQIKSQQDSFRIGTSSILFKYDDEVLEFLDYTSENFDENDKVDFFGSAASVWDTHKFNSSFAGTCNLTLLSEIAAASFPTIENEWLTIGFARFTIKNINTSPNFTFDVGNTNFNRHSPNDGSQAPTKGVFAANGDLLATQCACDVPTLNNDTLQFDCPTASIEANISGNDIVSNPVYSIVSNPTKGTASINPNGTLLYTSNAAFCGEDELTYKVCNDSDDNCCAEAKVTLQFNDELPPIFMNAPADMTVSCGNVPEMGAIQALDNCFLAGIEQKEIVEDGICGSSKVYVRTWTAFDLCDNLGTHIQRITEVDDIAPTINCAAESIINCSAINGAIIETEQPVISDNCASLEEMTITFTDEVISEVCENKVQRQFNRTWTATDACGNFATCTQLVKIIDDTAPVLICPDDVTVNCGQSISPESLESFATAFDSCSSVALSFVDEGTVPTDCGVENVTIVRTWTATDACGNETSCTQRITLAGEPCPRVVEKEIVVYQCEKDIVNLMALANLSADATVSFSNKNTQEPIFNTTQYLLPSTGCQIGNFEFAYQIFDERQCTVENSVLIIKTIPRVIGDAQLTDSCTAELVLECPDLYNVSWQSGDEVGTGNIYNATAGESGVVVFNLNFIGLDLPDSLELPCLTQQYEVAFDCPKPCPASTQEELTIVGCQGDFINLKNRLQIGDSERFEADGIDADITEYPLVGDSLTCGVSEKIIQFTIFNEDNCPIRYVSLKINIILPIQGEIIHENDFCKAKLELSCSDFYEVTWKDDSGNIGIGAIYEGTEGASGYVTFYVAPISDLYQEERCGRDSFQADFSCPSLCPDVNISDTLINSCAGENLDLYNYLALPSGLEFTFEYAEPITGSGASIANGQIEIGNPFGCEKGFLELKINGYDERQCLVEVREVSIAVLPEIFGTIQYPDDSTFCNPSLILECEEYYQIVWEDNAGNGGIGGTYNGVANTTGYVTFYVYPIDSTLTNLPCAVDSFIADFSCIPDCPPSIAADWLINVCGEETINIEEYFDIDPNARYTVNGIEVSEDQTVTFTNQSCEIKTTGFEITVFDSNDCVLISHGVGVTIYPTVLGNISYESLGTLCTPKLFLECPEHYQVTWSDDLGNSGEGNIYEATAGTNGTVAFYVTPLVDSLFDFACPIDTFQADFNCESACPETIERTEELTVCAGTQINILDRLGLSPNTFYVSDNEAILDSIYFVGNPFGCEIGTKEYTLKAYDDNQCLLEIITVKATVIPEIFGSFYQFDDGSCEVKFEIECIENYAITWEDTDGNTGTGPIYVASENTSGIVTFTVEYLTDRIILSDVELGCFTQQFESDYNCSADCPPTIAEDRILTICGEESINMPNYLDIAPGFRYVVIGVDLDESGNVKFENTECEPRISSFSASVYNTDGCLIRDIGVQMQISPTVNGTIRYESDSSYCNPKLFINCTENYEIAWTDNLGGSGTGNSYVGASGTNGIVAFYVTPIADSLFDFACPIDTIYADFNCESACPPTIERNEFITVCAETSVNLFERLGLGDDKQYVIDSEYIADGIYRVGNPFGCEMGMKEFEFKAYDDLACLVEVIQLTVQVIPAIYAETIVTQDNACGVSLVMECPENYEVNWEDTDGNTGVGASYTALEGTSGTVTFYANYLKEEIILSDEEELGCFNHTFSADYNCASLCPDPDLKIIDLYGCEGDEINLFNRLDFSDNFTYTIVDNENELDLASIKLEKGIDGCTISQFTINVEMSDENGCVIGVFFIAFNVIPKIDAQLVNSTENCGVQLEVACADVYDIRWEDNLGNTGIGSNYVAEEGKQGTVLFYVTVKDTTLLNEIENTGCLANEFSGEFGCCAPVGTACDDGKDETFADMEDGECGCIGTPCALENSGTVIDRTGLDACSLLIEMEDGTILEPVILPEGLVLVAGQKVIFSFVELVNNASACQVGKIVQIICLETNCPEKGTPCTDGDLATINDAEDGNCNCVGESVPEITSEIDLRFRPRLDCDSNTYCVILQGKGQQEDFFIGTSSIMVNYNADALEFSGYTSTQFDKDTDCTGGNMELWDDHKFDGSSVPGKFCLTMTLNGEGVSCPEITTAAWEDFGVLCFDIMDNDASPKLTFEANNTHFNSATNNDGSTQIALGQLGTVAMDDVLACAQSDAVSTNELALKAMLQGPFESNKGLMNDRLRRKSYIPQKEPYTGIPSFNHIGEGGGEEMVTGLLDVAGDDAIVDWVFVELRSEDDSTMVFATRSALIQRDGDVVDVDGTSNLQLNIPDGNYYVCVKHRNHLGVMTAAPLAFQSGTPTTLDFTDPTTPTYGTHALQDYQGTMVLWGGNANPDGYIILAGGGLGLPDRDMIFFDIFLSLWYSNPSAPITYNSVLHGYYGSDTNMDGKVKYQGPKNDIDAIIFFNVLFHPGNTRYRLNYAIFEQIP